MLYQKILVPLDGSKRAEAILPHIEELALRYQADVIFLVVIEPLFIGDTSIYKNPLFDQQNLQRQTQQMTQYLATQQEAFQQKGLSVRTFIRYGRVVDEILGAAQAENVDLIALTSHGHTGLSRVFYGSVAAALLHRIDRPLLLIRSLEN